MIKNDIYVPTKYIYNQGQDPEIIKVIDLEEQIESILWEIDFLRNKKV